MHENMGASTPAIEKLCALSRESGKAEGSQGLTIDTINKLFMLTLPAHLQLNCGKPLDSEHRDALRDALRAKIIRSALS